MVIQLLIDITCCFRTVRLPILLWKLLKQNNNIVNAPQNRLTTSTSIVLQKEYYTVKLAHVATSIEQPPVLKGLPFLVPERARPCRDRMVVGFTTICAISAFHH